MNPDIDHDKFLALSRSFASHEKWIQSGCPVDNIPVNSVPGYLALASQNPAAYALYRHSIFLYLAELRGNEAFYKQLKNLIADMEEKSPNKMSRFWQLYQLPDKNFKEQWNNLFDPFLSVALSHDNCFKYLQKYEIEFVLIVFAQLRQIDSGKGLDFSLNRFRDSNGKLRKGAVIDYITKGFNRYPAIKRILVDAYNSNLRNIIGHNEYKIVDREIKSLDGKITVSEKQFFSAYIALQEIQNAVLWLFVHEREPNLKFASYGIPSIGFDTNTLNGEWPNLIVYQIDTFRQLDFQASWLRQVEFSIEEGTLTTFLQSPDIHQGKIIEDLETFLHRVNRTQKIRVKLVPVMPCVHKDDHSIRTKWGNFCLHGPIHEVVIPAVLKGYSY